jgi:hypothetical protein
MLIGSVFWFRYHKIYCKYKFFCFKIIGFFHRINFIIVEIFYVVHEKKKLFIQILKIFEFSELLEIYKYSFFFINFFNSCKSIYIPSLLSCFLVIFFLDFFNIFSVNFFSIYLVVGFIIFWLMSGFTFFLKRYRFGKFTSSVQRFWKRTFVYFWLVECYMFFLFFYFFLNSSQESLYFYDESSSNLNFLTSLNSFYYSYLLLLLVIILLYFLLLNIMCLTFMQYLWVLIICFILNIYIFLLETYQFYYLLTLLSQYKWTFNGITNLWSLELETIIMRPKLQYLFFICIIKYWHLLFIFLSFVFFLIKSFERRRVSYALVSYNIQNFFILFFLNVLLHIQWLKWVIWRFFELPYFWFFSSYNLFFLHSFISESFWFLCNIFM